MEDPEEDLMEMATVRLNFVLPRADAEEYLARLVAWHKEQGFLLNGGVKYAVDEKTYLYVLNNQVSDSLGIKWKDGTES